MSDLEKLELLEAKRLLRELTTELVEEGLENLDIVKESQRFLSYGLEK